jgi:thioredoxin-like negative regulator of GroEL
MRRTTEALAKLSLCFRASPHEVEALLLLAECFEASGRWREAISVLEEVTRIERERADVRLRLSALREKAGGP